MKRKRKVFPFLQGLEKGDVEPQLATGLLKCENAVATEKGRIDKRPGFSSLTGSSYTDKWLATFRDRPVLFGDGIAVKDNSAIRAGSLDTIESQLGFVKMSSQPLVSKAADLIKSPEVAVLDDVLVMTYVHDGAASLSLQIVIRDRYSGKTISTTSTGATASGDYMGGKLIADSSQDRIYVIYLDATGEVAVRSVNSSSGAISAENSIAAWPTVDANKAMDVALVDDGYIMIAYKENAANNLIVGRLVMTGDTVTDNDATADNTPTVGPNVISICKWATGEAAVVYSYDDGGGTYTTKVTSFDGSGAGAPSKPGTSGPNDVNVFVPGAVIVDGLTCLTNAAGDQIDIWRTGGDMIYRDYWKAGMTNLGEIGGDCVLWCRPFRDSNGRTFIGYYFHPGLAAASDTPQSTYFLLEDRATNWPTPVGKWFVDSATRMGSRVLGWTPNPVHGAPCVSGTDEWIVAGLEVGADFYNSVYTQKNILHAIKIRTDVDTVKPISTPSALIFPGAAPAAFDGQQALELGFLAAPDGGLFTASAGGSGGGWLESGTLYFRAMYEWHDAEGRRYMSPVSPAISVATTATETVTVLVPTCKISRLLGAAGAGLSDIRVVLYCIDAFGSSVYRRLSIVEVAEGGEQANDPTTSTLTFSVTDFPGSSDEQEYTRDGQVLQNYQPPPSDIMCIWGKRLVAVHAQYPDRLLEFSKEFIEGEGVFFSGLRLEVPPRNGDIIAIEAVGERLAIFKRRAIFMTHGEGWDEQGAGGGYQRPFAISEGIGCSNLMSVIKTPIGTFFESDDCMHLLTNDFQVQPIGRDVRRETDEVTIVDAAVLADQNLVIWMTSEGTALLYNWLFNQWMTWTGLDADSCVVADGVLFYKDTSSSRVLYQDADTNIDHDASVTTTIETGWITFGDPLVEARVFEIRLLGYANDEATLTIKIAYDFSPVWIDSLTYSPDGNIEEFGPSEQFGAMATITDEDQALILKIDASKTRCNAIRLQFSW